MALTVTKAQLLALVQRLPDDAQIYVMVTKESVNKAFAASRTVEEDEFLRIAKTNVLREANEVSLIAYVE
jgi:hypothetical protein